LENEKLSFPSVCPRKRGKEKTCAAKIEKHRRQGREKGGIKGVFSRISADEGAGR